ncbi:MAG: 16S rRNA (cytosine(1402)-N(4))-methyltransferase RsmH [bacterium]
MSYQHQSVLLEEVIELLNPQPNQHFIDCTLGGGGHAEAILERTGPNGKLLGIDLDDEAIKNGREKLARFGDRVVLIQGNFKNINKIKDEFFPKCAISGILADLGLSSNQLAGGSGRGFSFKVDQQLDMRLDDKQALTAAEIVNHYSEEQLFEIFQNYGQEKLAGLIAQKIIVVRQKHPPSASRRSGIKTTAELVEIILAVYRQKLKSQKEIPWIGGLHPATKVFQALRIAVNDELENLRVFLAEAIKALSPNGRLAVISFHSLEDRIIKQFFKNQSDLKIINKKVIPPSFQERKNNPRSRSAKLRVAAKK